MRLRVAAAAVILALMVDFSPPASAEVIVEAVTALRCSEGSKVKLPKKMRFQQNVLVKEFEDRDQVALVVIVGYEDRANLNKGKVIANATLVKPDGTRMKLGSATARIREGEGEKIKIINRIVEQGDVIEWLAKLKKLPKLEPPSECWELQLGLAVADDIPQ